MSVLKLVTPSGGIAVAIGTNAGKYTLFELGTPPFASLKAGAVRIHKNRSWGDLSAKGYRVAFIHLHSSASDAGVARRLERFIAGNERMRTGRSAGYMIAYDWTVWQWLVAPISKETNLKLRKKPAGIVFLRLNKINDPSHKKADTNAGLWNDKINELIRDLQRPISQVFGFKYGQLRFEFAFDEKQAVEKLQIAKDKNMLIVFSSHGSARDDNLKAIFGNTYEADVFMWEMNKQLGADYLNSYINKWFSCDKTNGIREVDDIYKKDVEPYLIRELQNINAH